MVGVVFVGKIIVTLEMVYCFTFKLEVVSGCLGYSTTRTSS